MASWTYTWTTFSWSLPDVVDNGGYLTSPGGPLETLLASNSDLTWLRECDRLEWVGTCYKLTRTWLGAITGHWPEGIYPEL
jgi:hypothetical protein